MLHLCLIVYYQIINWLLGNLANILLDILYDCNQLISVVGNRSHITDGYCVVGISQIPQPLHLVEFFVGPWSRLFCALDLSEEYVSFY